MSKLRNSILLLMLLLGTEARGQEQLRSLSKDQFLSILRMYHPVAKQAGLQVERAKAEVLSARGAFDPRVDVGQERKSVDGKLYYSYFNPELSIPTWYGIDIHAGVEEVLGSRANTELTQGKTSYLGLKLPANNLLFDSRRATVRQAQAYSKLSEAERRLVINDLFFDALSAYWNWVREYLNYSVLTATVQVNEERLKFVRIEFEQGARPAIDTTEALAQLQNFYLQQSAAWMAFQNAGLELSNYLWLDEERPVSWSPEIVPAGISERSLNDMPGLPEIVATASRSHPKLQALGFKTDMLEIDRRLKQQYLLPKLSVKANLLSDGYSFPSETSIPFLENNYKFGVDFSLPLFLRQARGTYKAATIKVNEMKLQQDQTGLEIENKIKSYYNEVLQTDKQIRIYEDALGNYVRLFQGERLRFENGESTLFLLNSRENKVLEATQKLYELQTKWHKSYAGLLWAAGQLN